MSGIICDFCGLPVVPLGGEELCECPPESDWRDDYGEDWDEAPETDEQKAQP